jgi:hypothetical protein
MSNRHWIVGPIPYVNAIIIRRTDEESGGIFPQYGILVYSLQQILKLGNLQCICFRCTLDNNGKDGSVIRD